MCLFLFGRSEIHSGGLRICKGHSCFLKATSSTEYLCLMTRRTSGSCASGVSEGHNGLFCLFLISEGCWALNVAFRMGPFVAAFLVPGHEAPTSMTIKKRIKENPRQEHQFLEQCWLAERANTAIVIKCNIGGYRVWFGHSFHSQLCPLPLPVVSLTITLWCSPKNAQTCPHPILILLLPTQEASEGAGTWVEAALPSDGLSQPVLTVFSWHPRATLSSGSFGQKSREQYCSKCNYRRGKKKSYSRFKIACCRGCFHWQSRQKQHKWFKTFC